MKELDFDELDKAVNSLMGDTPQTDEPETNGPNVTTTTTNPVEPSSEGSEITPPPTDATIEEVTSPALPSPASRRGGRFMDVVHPSSDMKTTGMGVSSREGISITPPSADVPSMPSTEENTTASAEEVTTPAEDAAATSSSSEWPDPIALHEEKQADEAEEPAPDVSSPAPQTSPFLTDAKVEKRPLGGGQALDQAIANELGKVDSEQSNEATPTVVSQSDSLPAQETPTEAPAQESTPQLLTTPEEKTPLPAELDSDLVAIEAGGATTSNNQPVPAVPEPAAASPAPVIGGGSIQQQYTEQPSTGDDSHAAIYDTEAAQQPLLHPPKKKTGWLVTIWIVLIIILGVGVGATIWYFGLI